MLLDAVIHYEIHIIPCRADMRLTQALMARCLMGCGICKGGVKALVWQVKRDGSCQT